MALHNYNLINNILVPHTAMSNALVRIEQCYKAVAAGSAEPICILVIGDPRAGKSRMLEHFESKHQRYRIDAGLRLPVLRVKAPARPSVKALCEVMLGAIGDPCASKGTETNMTVRLKAMLQAVENKMIILDEFNHFVDIASDKVIRHAAEWLKMIADDSKCALVFSGLPSCQAVFNQNVQLAGRSLAPILMPRFNWKKQDDREEFVGILAAFQDGMAAYDMPKLDSDEMAFRFYCASGGLIGYIAKVLRQAVWNAVDADTRTISLSDLDWAHKQSVYVDENAADLPPAFERGFAVSPTELLLQRVQAIGVEAPKFFDVRNRNHQSKNKVSVRDVLHK